MISLIQQTLQPLKTLVGNIDDVALINVLNAKLTNMITQTGVKFKQYQNSNPATLSYYGINFMNSGSNKDYVVDCINNYLMPFLEEQLEKEIEQYKERYRDEQSAVRVGKKQEEAIEREIDSIRVANYELHNPNFTGLYKEAEQINKMEFGSLFIRIGELGDYLDQIVGGNQSKKELYQKLKDIYEGTIAPSIIAGDSKRQTLRQIPVQALMYTDFENLLNPKIKEYYLTSLKTGLARRSFIYMPTNSNKKLDYPQKISERVSAIDDLLRLQKQYFFLFSTLLEKEDKVYVMSSEASELIYQYNCQCIDYFNSSTDDLIVKIEKKESFWKITKLAVVYSIIDNPAANIVDAKYVQAAINFYNRIEPSLIAIITKRKESKVEQFAQFISGYKNKVVMMSDLRKSGIIGQVNFSKFMKDNFDDIADELQVSYNLTLYPYKGSKNCKGYQVVDVNNYNNKDILDELMEIEK